MQNVSQAVRAFLIGGQKAQFDGVSPRTGEKQWKAVSALQDEVSRTMFKVPKATPGSTIEFTVNPTITALTPLSAVAGFSGSVDKMTLNTEGLLDILSVDFSRALRELAAVLNDLKRLAALGDLPITYHDSTLCIHFPGVDADSVERLCDELGVQRGFIRQDEDFSVFVGEEIALLFPFAPSKTPSESSFLAKKPAHERPMYQAQPIDWRNMLAPDEDDDLVSSPSFSTRSEMGHDFEDICEENPWLSNSSPSGFESLHTSHARDSDSSDIGIPLEYQGFEGIYRFIEQCDNAPQYR